LATLEDLLKAQVEAVVTGDHEAVLSGSQRHDLILRELETAEVDMTPAELRSMYAQIDREKVKLQSLLAAETVRVDFLLRVILGGGPPKAGGYPKGPWPHGGPSSRLNRRT
jgi:hypothetical protein